MRVIVCIDSLAAALMLWYLGIMRRRAEWMKRTSIWPRLVEMAPSAPSTTSDFNASLVSSTAVEHLTPITLTAISAAAAPPQTTMFHLQDVQTGLFVQPLQLADSNEGGQTFGLAAAASTPLQLSASTFYVCDNDCKSQLAHLGGGDVWDTSIEGQRRSLGAVLIGINGSGQALFLRHRDSLIFAHPSQSGITDFSWIFHKTEEADVFTISSLNVANHWLGVHDSGSVVLSGTLPPWRFRLVRPSGWNDRRPFSFHEVNPHLGSFAVAAAHCLEDTHWLQQWQDLERDVHICSKAGCLPSQLPADRRCTVSQNRGFETSSFLKYIVAYYDTLPAYVAFIHAHEHSWHYNHVTPLMNLIDHVAANDLSGLNFLSLNNNHISAHDVNKTRTTLWEMEEQALRFNTSLLVYLNNSLKVTSSCDDMVYDCCAQFIVTRTAIQRLPLEAYERWLDAVMADELGGLGRLFEFVWHVLFTGRCDVPLIHNRIDYARRYFDGGR